MKTVTLKLCLAGSVLIGGGAAAQSPESGPMLPPELRKMTPAPAVSGEALQTVAMQKLKIRFEQADLDGGGLLSQEEARKAGLGFIVNHFEAIDTAKRGSVSFDELAAFMRQRRR